MNKRELTQCWLPVGVAWALVVTAYGSAGAVLSLSIGPVPLALLMTFLAVLTAIAPFIAHFEEGLGDRACWIAIAACGLAILVLFALLHAEAGILCLAPTCPNATAWPVDTPFIAAGLGNLPAQGPGSSSDNVDIANDLTTALYFSVVTFTTLGYGDFQPMPGMRVLAASEALIGYLFLGMSVGGLVDLGARHRQPAESGAQADICVTEETVSEDAMFGVHRQPEVLPEKQADQDGEKTEESDQDRNG